MEDTEILKEIIDFLEHNYVLKEGLTIFLIKLSIPYYLCKMFLFLLSKEYDIKFFNIWFAVNSIRYVILFFILNTLFCSLSIADHFLNSIQSKNGEKIILHGISLDDYKITIDILNIEIFSKNFHFFSSTSLVPTLFVLMLKFCFEFITEKSKL